MELSLGLLLSCALGGFLLGTLITYLFLQSRFTSHSTIAAHEESVLRQEIARLEKELGSRDELLERVENRFSDAFKALSLEALKSSSHYFLSQVQQSFDTFQSSTRTEMELRHQNFEDLSKQVVAKIHGVENTIRALETTRAEQDSSLRTEIKAIQNISEKVGAETSKLAQALSHTKHQGTWGEIQLRNLIESAGLLPYADFMEQVQISSEGEHYRPDLIVRFPDNRRLIIDAKAPTKIFLDLRNASSAEDHGKKALDLARSLKRHIRETAARNYPQAVEGSFPFIVIFIPIETLLKEALEADPELFDYSAEQNVLLATPLSLLCFFKVAGSSWGQQKLAHSALEICGLARELLERFDLLTRSYAALGQSLGSSIEHYNKTTRLIERKILPTTDRLCGLAFKEKKTTGETFPSLELPTKTSDNCNESGSQVNDRYQDETAIDT